MLDRSFVNQLITVEERQTLLYLACSSAKKLCNPKDFGVFILCCILLSVPDERAPKQRASGVIATDSTPCDFLTCTPKTFG